MPKLLHMTVDGELWSGDRRVIKTREEANNVFEEFHFFPIGGHTGVIKTRNAISHRFYWSGMTVDIENCSTLVSLVQFMPA